jgi:hypothetical protein
MYLLALLQQWPMGIRAVQVEPLSVTHRLLPVDDQEHRASMFYQERLRPKSAKTYAAWVNVLLQVHCKSDRAQ